MPKAISRAAGLGRGVKRRVLYLSVPDQPDRICSGCETCQLMCSLQNRGGFQPREVPDQGRSPFRGDHHSPHLPTM